MGEFKSGDSKSSDFKSSHFKSGACTSVARFARAFPHFTGKNRIFRRVCGLIGGTQGPLEVRLPSHAGFELLVDPRGRCEGGFTFSAELDRDDLDFLTRFIEPASRVLDIGGNIGLMAIPLCAHIRDQQLASQMLCFEPVPNNADRLRRNIAINNFSSFAQVIECALGDTETTMQMFRESEGGSETGNAILNAQLPGISQHAVSSVRVRPLDTILAELPGPPVSLIKLDVEGAEVMVLRGALGTLTRDRPLLYGEFHSGLMPLFNTDFSDVGKLLSPLDYIALGFTTRLCLKEIGFTPGKGNAVLCPREKLSLLRSRVDKLELTTA